jgi:hypothetical protein
MAMYDVRAALHDPIAALFVLVELDPIVTKRAPMPCATIASEDGVSGCVALFADADTEDGDDVLVVSENGSVEGGVAVVHFGGFRDIL